MERRKIQSKMLLVWWLRLCLGALACSFLAGVFFTPAHLPWRIVTAVWVVLFLVAFVWYFPMKYHKLSYTLGEQTLSVRGGVIYTICKTVLLNNIQYITVSAMPLPRLFGLCTIRFHVAGGMLSVPGLRLNDGLLLQELLTPRDVPRDDGEEGF